jgi:hypothetical protein
MRLAFNHPAVVTGAWENGNVRRELVRVAAEFEIAEYSDAEAPVTFDVNDLWQDQGAKIRTVGGRHYKRWRWDVPSAAFGAESQLFHSLYHGRQIDCSGIEQLVSMEVQRVKSIDKYRGIEHTGRKPLKREEEAGLSSLAVSCMKAPMLKNWQWLDHDTEAQVAEWRDKVSAVLANIAIVDGVPHVRAFEPCYRVSHAPLGSSKRGVFVTVDNAGIYAREVDRIHVDPRTGFELLGKHALSIGSHSFGPTEFQDLRRFCQESGWGSDERPQYDIVTHDPDAVGVDYLEMETVRHARMLHDSARSMMQLVVKRDDVDVFMGQEVDTHRMLAQMEALRVAIVAWQAVRNGTDDLAVPFEDLLEHVLHWEDMRLTKSTFDLCDHMDSFKVREDLAPVVVSPVSGATPCV